MTKFIELRKLLHSKPELSWQEENTANTILSFLKEYKPDKIITKIAGNGLAVEFMGKQKGPKVMVRSELDALPIQESLDKPYQSKNPGVSHKCGHDGHMAIVAGLAERLQKNRPNKGSVILLFQPAEETGEGAEKILKDSKFQQIQPDFAIALHNLPGYPLGQVITKPNIFASASSGLHIHLHGKTSHAAEPKKGKSPALAVAQLIQTFSSIAQFHTSLHQSAQVTVIHAKVGEIAFGTSPGEGDVMVTIRSHKQDMIDILNEKAISIARSTADMFGLDITINSKEHFPQTENDPNLTKIIEDSANKLDLGLHQLSHPFAWSEDFGHFTNKFKGALFGLGAGKTQPVLHHPDYDFPDDLIETGISIFSEIIKRIQVI